MKALDDIAPWRLAVVLEVNDQAARIGLQPGREPGGAVSKERETGIVPIEGVKWAQARDRRRPLQGAYQGQAGAGAGDMVYVEPLVDKEPASTACARCPRSPARSW